MAKGRGSVAAARVRAWRRLRWSYLVPAAAGLSLWYRWALRRRSFPDLLSPPPGEPPEGSAARLRHPAVSTVASAVRSGTRRWPFRVTCLVRSAVLARLLRRFEYPAVVVIGVAEDRAHRQRCLAHAWVELPDARTHDGYRELVRLIP